MQSTTTLLTEVGPVTVKVVRTLSVETKRAQPMRFKAGGDTVAEVDMSALAPSTEHSEANYTVTLSAGKGGILVLQLNAEDFRELLATLSLLIPPGLRMY